MLISKIIVNIKRQKIFKYIFLMIKKRLKLNYLKSIN